MKTQILLLIALCYVILHVEARSKYVTEEEDNPYEFGFTIDGQQHRHEKKDANGIIQGEFGFITADGIYHVTVYATDENGNFRILSMKNVRVSGPLDDPNAKLPDTSQFSKGQPNPAPAAPNPLSINTTPAPVQAVTPVTQSNRFTTQSTIKPACAGCGYVTHATPLKKPESSLPFQTQAGQNPRPQDVIIGQKLQGPAQDQSGFNVPPGSNAPFVSNPASLPANPSNPNVPGPNAVGQFNPESTYPENTPVNQNYYDQNEQNQQYQQNQENYPNQPNQQNQQDYPGNNVPPLQTSQISPKQPQTQEITNQDTPDIQKSRNQEQPQQTLNQPLQPQIYKQELNQQIPETRPILEQNPQGPIHTQQIHNQETPETTAITSNPIKPPQTHQISENNYNQPQDDPLLNPLSIDNQPNHLNQPAAPLQQFDSGITVDHGVINIPNNPPITIQDKYPNMVEGLPAGISEGDITDLLYRFNYTVGFHGHYEKGYKNGAKVGGYFVNDRDGVSRIVTYVADENGYRPKVKFIRLDLSSDLVPKEGTEKTFGLKNFEFVWYPLN